MRNPLNVVPNSLFALFISFIFLNAVFVENALAADVIIKTAGITADGDGLSVQNNSALEVLAVEGDGAVVAPQGRISDKSGLLSPVASVTMFAGSVVPTGWLICDGVAVDRTTYADLFALIGETYGNGDGSTTFNLPDMRGKGAIGYKSDNTKFDAMGETGGEETHALTTAEMPRHTHSGSTGGAGSHRHGFTGSDGDHGNNGNNVVVDNNQSVGTKYTNTVGNHTHSLSINNTGGNTAHNVLDPYLVMNFIIKY